MKLFTVAPCTTFPITHMDINFTRVQKRFKWRMKIRENFFDGALTYDCGPRIYMHDFSYNLPRE